MKKVLTALVIVTVAGIPAIYAATRPAATEAPIEVTLEAAAAPIVSGQQTDTMICPLTGEEIEPCCCPLNDEKDAKAQ